MSTTAIENNPILIDLTEVARSSGWTTDGTIARHSSCNSGNLYLLNYPLTIGSSYEYTFQILSISGGYVEVFLGTTHGAQYTTVTTVQETVIAQDTQLFIFSNANCTIENFVIREVSSIVDNKAENTIAFSEKTKKWVSFYSYIPDMGFSLYKDVFTGLNGNLYIHETGIDNRNNFYGEQYQSIINFVDATQPALPKTFQSLSIQCNELMITTSQGISTSLGQISELAAVDFIKSFLTDGVSQVNVTALEGIYAANLLRDINSQGGLLNGDALRGNYLLVELISTSAEPLLLYTINVVARRSPIGAR